MSCDAGGDVVAAVSNLTKRFRLFDRRRHRLAEALSFGLKRYHRPFTALNDVSFTVRRGEMVGVVGRNGSGKSTLLQIVCGTMSPSSGEVDVRGRVAALLELGAGFNPDFSGRENVYLNAALHGLSKAETDARLDDIFAFADIGPFIDQPVKTYSSGMFVRLAFAVIAHVDADILVIDEALAVGDAAFGQKCMRFLRAFRETGAIVFVSHDTAAITGLCDRAIWLDHGVVKAQGPARDVCERYFGHIFETGGTKDAPQADEPERRGEAPIVPPEDWVDARKAWIDASMLRNDLEVFAFNSCARSFGAGGAMIEDVRFTDPHGRPYRWIVGGEAVTLLIRARAKADLKRPIVGFYVKDRLGQQLFGDNTFLTTQIDGSAGAIAVKAGEGLEATFRFPMPILPRGSYVLAAAVADGAQTDHTPQHWAHEALVFRSHAGHAAAGLVGIPMLDISLTLLKDAASAPVRHCA